MDYIVELVDEILNLVTFSIILSPKNDLIKLVENFTLDVKKFNLSDVFETLSIKTFLNEIDEWETTNEKIILQVE